MTTEKRIDVGKLLENISQLMPKGIFESLPEISKYDFAEAGKCIAFERATAAAFHILRGTEGMLKQYYFTKMKRNRVKQLLWANMLTSLRSKKKAPSAIILNHLQNIKDDFRNPTAHPEKIYDIDEVQDLLSRCIDVVSRMIKDC